MQRTGEDAWWQDVEDAELTQLRITPGSRQLTVNLSENWDDPNIQLTYTYTPAFGKMMHCQLNSRMINYNNVANSDMKDWRNLASSKMKDCKIWPTTK